MARTRRKTKKRERTLGQAIGLGLAATLGVGLLILIVQLLIPSTTVYNFFRLAHAASSATLRGGTLFQEWAGDIQEQEALFATPFSLLCGGLILGRFAPRYASYRRVLTAGGWMAFGTVAVSLAFAWPAAVIQQEKMNRDQGGHIFHISAPPDLLVRQSLWAFAWIAVCVLGTWVGLRLRDRRVPSDPAPALRPARR